MKRRHFQPSLKKRFVETHDGYDVYTIDPFAIRNAAQPDEEFDNGASHADFPDLIPEGEIWTNRATYRREGQFFITNAATEMNKIGLGKSGSEAFDAGVEAERTLRERVTGIKFRNGRPHRRVPDQIYFRRYVTLMDEEFPVEVWKIDGFQVRCLYKTDYTEGGHGFVYRWCPKDEIWVEKVLEEMELPYIVAHEYIELRLMRDLELEYDRAHEICAEMEFDLRKAASRKRFPGLSARKLSREQLEVLVTPEFFEYVQRQYVRNPIRRARALISDVASKILP